jgi:hypothetical protein
MALPTITREQLKPGDVLLYLPKGLFGWIIFSRTWHRVGHCECYIGNGFSVASRDGKGVNVYPLRTAELATVCRPRVPFDLEAGLRWFKAEAQGLPYGWLDLLNFTALSVDHRGMICSTFLALFCRACGYDPFQPDEPATKIAPFQFGLSPVYEKFDYR